MRDQPRLLVVDEHDDSRIIISSILRHAGFDVDVADDGRAAIVSARAQPPALFVIELQMRELSGFETLMLLRLDRSLEHIPAVAISGYPLERDALANGFQGFLRKPLGMDSLIGQVRRLIEPPLLA